MKLRSSCLVTYLLPGPRCRLRSGRAGRAIRTFVLVLSTGKRALEERKRENEKGAQRVPVGSLSRSTPCSSRWRLVGRLVQGIFVLNHFIIALLLLILRLLLPPPAPLLSATKSTVDVVWFTAIILYIPLEEDHLSHCPSLSPSPSSHPLSSSSSSSSSSTLTSSLYIPMHCLLPSFIKPQFATNRK